MIKKILLIVLTPLIFICPMASANDFGVFEDPDRYVTYTYTVDKKSVEIGEVLNYTIKVTNHTEMEFKYFFTSNVFEGSWQSVLADEDELYSDDRLGIKPYETMTVEYTRIVPDDISWYEENGKYYIDFAPNINYAAANNDDYKDDFDGKTCEYFINYADREPIKIEITNIVDGAPFAQLNITDNRDFVVFDETSKYDYGQVNSIAALENIGDTAITIENIESSLGISSGAVTDCVLKPGAKVLYEREERYYLDENGLPETMLLEHNALFSMDDGFYYALSTLKKFEPMIITPPEIYIKAEKNDDYTKYYVVNNSSDTINDLVVCYTNSSYYMPYEIFNTRAAIITLKAGEQWEVPKKYTGDYLCEINLGYLIDDCMYFWVTRIYDGNSDNQILDIDNTSDGMCKRDYYKEINSIYLSVREDFPSAAEPTATSISKSTIAPPETPIPQNITTALKPTASPAPTPQIKSVEKYYIPKWAWIAFSAAFLAVTFIVGYLVTSENIVRK